MTRRTNPHDRIAADAVGIGVGLVTLILLALLLGGCASGPRWLEHGDPIVRAGRHKETITFYFYADQESLHRAYQADNRVLPQRREYPPVAYTWEQYREVHTVVPVMGDPYWICVLGHEVLHILSPRPQSPSGYHGPMDDTQCGCYINPDRFDCPRRDEDG